MLWGAQLRQVEAGIGWDWCPCRYRACEPQTPEERMARAGYPYCISCLARPSEGPADCGYYVGAALIIAATSVPPTKEHGGGTIAPGLPTCAWHGITGAVSKEARGNTIQTVAIIRFETATGVSLNGSSVIGRAALSGYRRFMTNRGLRKGALVLSRSASVSHDDVQEVRIHRIDFNLPASLYEADGIATAINVVEAPAGKEQRKPAHDDDVVIQQRAVLEPYA